MNNVNVNKNDYVKIIVFIRLKNNYFSLNLKYYLDCSSKKSNKKLFNLELDYFGFFEVLGKDNYNQKLLTENGFKLLFPFAKEIIEDITQKGGSVPILLNDVDFELKRD